MVEISVMKAYLCTQNLAYNDDANTIESWTRLRDKLEWMIIWAEDCSLTCAAFDVAHLSRKNGSLLVFDSVLALLKSGVRIDESKFPLFPYFLRRADASLGLAIPPLLSLGLYSNSIGRRMLKLSNMAPGRELSEKLQMKRRWELLVELEIFSVVFHSSIRQYARIPVRSLFLLDVFLGALPDNMMGISYTNHHNGTPRDTLNYLFQANSIGRRYWKSVNVPVLP